ncbi:uncharacterized protein [Rutidosis leptorrhynchoides]|uniref:uncharacterized protein n=1 Tax=Rutidosis leptorrhynchoides TaxID=125765 RepID=UPI003A9A6040
MNISLLLDTCGMFPLRQDRSSWSWRKILLIRPLIRNFIVCHIGDGKLGSAWFDDWPPLGPLNSLISTRDINRAGCNSKSTVSDIIENRMFKWPPDWLSKYPNLQLINAYVFTNEEDIYGWKKDDAVVFGFSVKNAWDSFRPRSAKVPWFSVVWYSQGIPKHSFLLWLVMGERLKMQDKLISWDIRDGSTPLCAFCKQCADSHAHLFFSYSYSANVWRMVQQMMILDIRSNDWHGVVDCVTPLASRNLAHVLVSKLCLAATIYDLWLERNNRIFKKVFRTEKQVFDAIFSNVRLQLMTIQFKSSSNVTRIREIWKLEDV